jgi:hypothetical protein
MQTARLNSKNKLTTPGSGTTVYINFSQERKILEVEFDGAKTYHYLEVETEVWKEYKSLIREGKSAGIFVNTKIKPFYDYKEVL